MIPYLHKQCLTDCKGLFHMTSYEIRAYVNELSKFIRDKFYSDFKNPKVEFTIKPGSMIAGKAFLSDNTVDFNIKIAQMNGDDFKKTVEHELAHMMAYHVYKDTLKQQHGPEFRNMCKLLGNNGETHYSGYTIDSRDYKKVTRHEYTCKCGSHYLTPTTHRRLSTKNQEMRCMHCKEVIVNSSVIVKVSSNTPRYIKKES